MGKSQIQQQEDKPAAKKKSSGLVLVVVIGALVLAIAAAGYYFLQDMRKPAQDPEELALERDVQSFLQTSERLQQSYAIKKTIKSLPVSLPGRVRSENGGAWLLCDGQFAGRVNRTELDTALVAYPISRKSCERINLLLWQETTIKASGMPIGAWQAGKADTLGLFDGKDRLEACVSVGSGEYLYFLVVNQSASSAPSTQKDDSSSK